MKSILIVSSPSDYHAAAVSWALKKRGIRPLFLDTTSHTSSQDFDCAFNDYGGSCRLADAENIVGVWRRRLYPRDINPDIHVSDRKFVDAEMRQFESAMLEMLHYKNNCRWINPPYPAKLAENKMLQLQLIHENGGKIPRTLVGRSPERVREFLKRERNIVVKPQIGHFWMTGEKYSHQTRAAVLSSLDGVDDRAISHCPMIYQEKLAKVADVRVVMIGQYFYAVRFTNPRSSDETIDHRLEILLSDTKIEKIDLPIRYQQMLREVSRRLGICYASADFAELPDGELVFLDLNPAGQFIFIEQLCPYINLLSPFVNFLCSDDNAPIDGKISVEEFLVSEEYKYWEAYLSVGNTNAYRPSSMVSVELPS